MKISKWVVALTLGSLAVSTFAGSPKLLLGMTPIKLDQLDTKSHTYTYKKALQTGNHLFYHGRHTCFTKEQLQKVEPLFKNSAWANEQPMEFTPIGGGLEKLYCYKDHIVKKKPGVQTSE